MPVNYFQPAIDACNVLLEIHDDAMKDAGTHVKDTYRQEFACDKIRLQNMLALFTGLAEASKKSFFKPTPEMARLLASIPTRGQILERQYKASSGKPYDDLQFVRSQFKPLIEFRRYCEKRSHKATEASEAFWLLDNLQAEKAIRAARLAETSELLRVLVAEADRLETLLDELPLTSTNEEGDSIILVHDSVIERAGTVQDRISGCRLFFKSERETTKQRFRGLSMPTSSPRMTTDRIQDPYLRNLFETLGQTPVEPQVGLSNDHAALSRIDAIAALVANLEAFRNYRQAQVLPDAKEPTLLLWPWLQERAGADKAAA